MLHQPQEFIISSTEENKLNNKVVKRYYLKSEKINKLDIKFDGKNEISYVYDISIPDAAKYLIYDITLYHVENFGKSNEYPRNLSFQDPDNREN
ncbi:hypothetical protein L6Q85_07710 [bacterium]|nr:MAG: hypothetical protein UZ16_OP3001001549 [Candidatus Hinthialibacteria bacterium OLB16]MCK6496131.1 hypothetical protein [bacterium]NUP93787.1 hypothetical protein [Candidatus Omnitrophota bacterium]